MGMPARVFALAFGVVMTAGCGAKADGSAGTPLASSSAASSALAAQRSEDQAPLADKTGGFDGERAYAHVEKQVAFGPRPSGSAAIGKLQEYIQSELTSYGCKVDECDVLGENAGHLNRQKRMLKLHPGKVGTFELSLNAGFLDSAFRLQSRNAIRREQQRTSFGFDHDVFKIGMKRQRAVVRNCPGGGSPDHRAHVRAALRGFARTAAYDTEFDPDRGAGVVFVLDFGFGQRRGIVDAPIHRLASAVDVAGLHEIEKRTGDGGLVVEAHRQVRVVPAADDAEALEVALMLLDIAGGKLAAQLAKLRRRHFAFAAQFLFDLRFDGQSVTVPTRP